MFKLNCPLALKQSEISVLANARLSAISEKLKLTNTGDKALGDIWDYFQELDQKFLAQIKPTDYGTVRSIPVNGGMFYKDLAASLYGDTNTEELVANIDSAASNPAVTHTVLNFDTPGGHVAGIEVVAAAINNHKAIKPIYAYIENQCCSAGYYAASQCSSVFLGSELAGAGCIGVYKPHFDKSALLESMGIKITEFQTGVYKSMGSSLHTPTDPEKAAIQAELDTIHTQFVSTVSSGRGLDTATVAKLADGRTYSGSAAIELGLADQILTFKEVLQMATNENELKAAQDALVAEKAKTEQMGKDLAETQAAVAAMKADAAKLAKDQASVECIAMYSTAKKTATKEQIEAYCSMDVVARSMVAEALAGTTVTTTVTENLTKATDFSKANEAGATKSPLLAAVEAHKAKSVK
jgi:signal peptide peptidase SppA